MISSRFTSVAATCRWLRSPMHSARGSPARISSLRFITAFPSTCLKPTYNRGQYVAFLGRISPEKRPDRAIRVARALDIPIKIAAKIDKVDEAYFRATIAPLFSQSGVEYVGEIDERAKSAFLGAASALLFPVDWPEPFGLSMIEAMACGTPVLAFRCGSVPEIIDPGVTGQIVRTMDEAIEVLPQVLALDS